MPTEAKWQNLLDAARSAAENAYTPYSAFPVGAALLTAQGEIFSGANVENASYSLTQCAERSALCTAIGKGHKSFEALVVYAPCIEPTPPCGACRQVLLEFAPGLPVRSYDEQGRFREWKLDALLPEAFGPGHVQPE